MRKLVVTLTLVLTGLATQGAHSQQPTDNAPTADSLSNEWTGSWFVELSSLPTTDGTDPATIQQEQNQFHFNANQIAYEPERNFQRLWNGLTVRAGESAAAQMRLLPGVKAVYPVVHVRLLQQDTGNLVPEMVTALAQTRADVAQDTLGLNGEGVRVAVMDSGIDYDHPDLGGCFGPGCRVETGFDLVGDAYNSSSPTSVRAPDPLPDDCGGHGTHVAGIIGASGDVRGVAPSVTFHAYRVFGCTGTTSTDVMLEAMEMIAADGADVLNMSIGTPFQWPSYPVSQAADRLTKEGVIVVAAMGNDGPSGLYAAAAPGNGSKVISVASVDNTHANLAAFAVSPDDRLVGYGSASGSPLPPATGAFPLARTGTTTSTADACNGATAPAPGSLTGTLALIRRGTCSFYEKAFNAQAAGAVGVVLYNNVAGRISATVAGTPPITIPVVAITAADGSIIDARIAAGPTTLTWTGSIVSDPLATAGLISSFSSYGLPPDLSMKPDIAAPGGNIRSTFPLELGGVGPNSGTSMASPHVAGAIALLLQGRPNLGGDVDAVTALLQNNAKPRPWFGNPTLGFLDNVHRQGAGLMDITDAVQAGVVARPSRLALGEVEGGPVTREITIGRLHSNYSTNAAASKEGITYTLGHEPALATGANTFTPSFLSSFATVAFSSPTVSISGATAGKVSFSATITRPANASARLFGGYITLTPNDGGPALRVPYVGYNGDYQGIQTLVPTVNNFPWLARLAGTTFTNQPAGATFGMTGTDIPYFLLHLDHAVSRIVLEVSDAATGKIRGILLEQKFLARNSAAASFFSVGWDGTLVDGSEIANGTYTVTMRVLKALGDRNNPAHTEVWTSPPITIARPPETTP